MSGNRQNNDRDASQSAATTASRARRNYFDSKHTSAPNIDAIRGTLETLEDQVAEYRRWLEGFSDAHPTVAPSDHSEIVVTDDESLEQPEADFVAPVAVAVDVPAAELDSTYDVPDVDMPHLFGELDNQLQAGLHDVACVAVYKDGELVVDYVSSLDGSGASPESPLLLRGFSSGKPLAAAVLWRLMDRGIVDPDAPVARYWPEFAQRGKSGVTLRHVLTHTSGLPIDFGRGDVDWVDWGRMADIMASMEPMYTPGTNIHYHPISFGLLIGEIASRATGVPFNELFEYQVRRPLGLVDAVFAIDEHDASRRRRVVPLTAAADYHDQAMPQKMDWLLDNQIVSPGATCVTSARDLASLYATLCGDGPVVDTDAWLSDEARRSVYAEHADAFDATTMVRTRVGQGLWIYEGGTNRTAAPGGEPAFGHGGMGTCIGWGDPAHELAVAILTDKLQIDVTNEARLNRISAAIRQDFDVPAGEVADL